MAKKTITPTSTAAIAINPRATYTFFGQTTWKNGQVTVESHRYLGTELAECFVADEIQTLLRGKIATRKDRFSGATTRWVNADALADAAFAKAR